MEAGGFFYRIANRFKRSVLLGEGDLERRWKASLERLRHRLTTLSMLAHSKKIGPELLPTQCKQGMPTNGQELDLRERPYVKVNC